MRPYDHKLMAEKYEQSQYRQGSGSKGIGDDGLYAFAGYYYISGGDPTQVNFEHPPLGKYIIGLSILLFKNENALYPALALLLIIGTMVLVRHLYNNHLLTLVSGYLLVLSQQIRIQYVPVNTAQMGLSLLDLPLAVFFVWGIVAFYKAQKKPGIYFLSSLLFGLAFSVKFFPSLVLILGGLCVYMYRFQKSSLKIWLVSLLLVPVVYLISYLMFFKYHFSFIEFINFHRYLVGWRLGNPVVWGNALQSLLTGSYRNWWDGGYVFDREWNFEMPLLLIASATGAILAIKHKKISLYVLMIISGIYFLYLNFGTTGVIRYSLPIYPLLLILSLYPLKLIINSFHHSPRKF